MNKSFILVESPIFSKFPNLCNFIENNQYRHIDYFIPETYTKDIYKFAEDCYSNKEYLFFIDKSFKMNNKYYLHFINPRIMKCYSIIYLPNDINDSGPNLKDFILNYILLQ